MKPDRDLVPAASPLHCVLAMRPSVQSSLFELDAPDSQCDIASHLRRAAITAYLQGVADGSSDRRLRSPRAMPQVARLRAATTVPAPRGYVTVPCEEKDSPYNAAESEPIEPGDRFGFDRDQRESGVCLRQAKLPAEWYELAETEVA
jgi:hypothetical protein